MACAAERPATRPQFEVADLVRDFGAAFRQRYPISPDQAEVLRAILACRTPALGGHLDVCDTCGFSRPSYNSCRNRHCPKCQALAQAKWIAKREERLLPVPHFHGVFTVPKALRRLTAFYRGELFDLLFAAASETLAELAATRLHAQLGVTLVLHTWTRDLQFHPHVHAIITAGGLSLDGSAWNAQPKFLFPVRVMGALFRGKFLAGLNALKASGVFHAFDDFRDPQAFDRWMAKLARQRWVVYAKSPFGGVENVVSYLGRYTHRVGISNHRLCSRNGDSVTFATKNGATATISGVEFLRRFTWHVLPKGFVKIRHYGLYSSSHVNTRLLTARHLVTSPAPAPPLVHGDENSRLPVWKATLQRLTGIDVDRCPSCLVGTLHPQALPPLFDTS